MYLSAFNFILFVRACYLDISYLSQNSLVEHTKRFSQVIVSSSQKPDHIVYLPLLLIMQMMLK